MTKILIVDDEPAIADLVTLYLKNEGFEVRTVYQGAEALTLVKNEPFDLAILDVMIPDVDGFTICQEIRKDHHFPVIMLTAKETEIDKITGLTLGADDYITKPFKPLELVARVKAQLRRFMHYNSSSNQNQNVITIRGLLLDLDKHECWLDEKQLSLTPTEFAILKILCENVGRVVSSEDLFAKVWQEKYYTNASKTVMVHIRHLRRKMGDTAEKSKYIRTVWGVGYKIEA